jgi:hypothetical protein
VQLERPFFGIFVVWRGANFGCFVYVKKEDDMSIMAEVQDVLHQLTVLAAQPLTEETLARLHERCMKLQLALVLAGEVVRGELAPEEAQCETEPATVAEIVDAIHEQRRVWQAMEGRQPLASVDLRRGN